MFWNTVNRHYVRQVNLCRGLAGELNLCLLGSLLKSLERHRIFGEVYAAVVVLELLYKPLDNLVVKVVTAKVGISVCGFNLKHTVAKLKD